MSHLQKFVSRLEECGYFSLYSSFGDGNLRNWDWKTMSGVIKPPLKLFWDLFLCGLNVDKSQFCAAVSNEVLERLLECGILKMSGGSTLSSDYILAKYFGCIFLNEQGKRPGPLLF